MENLISLSHLKKATAKKKVISIHFYGNYMSLSKHIESGQIKCSV